MTKEEIERTHDKSVLHSRILCLLDILSSNDYKNIKNGEAERAGVTPLPYDAVSLYKENQAHREEIELCKRRIQELERVDEWNNNEFNKLNIRL